MAEHCYCRTDSHPCRRYGGVTSIDPCRNCGHQQDCHEHLGDSVRLTVVLGELAAELARAQATHRPMASAHEGWAVLYEELDELWDEVRKRQPDVEAMRREALQVAAMGLRFVLDVCKEAR